MTSTVLTLLDQLENLVASAPSLPVSDRIIVARTQVLELIDAMRVEALKPTAAGAIAGDGRGH